MKFSTEYTWYSSYIDTDILWLSDSLNWDDVFDLATSEYNVFGLFSAAFFLNTHHFLDWFVKLSTLDTLFISDASSLEVSTSLLNAIAWDHSLLFSNVVFSLPSLFYSDFQDLITTVTYYSPEVVIAMHDLVSSYWLGSATHRSPSASFDLYQDLTATVYSEFTDYLIAFSPFVVYVVLLVSIARVIPLTNSTDAYTSRAYFYLYSMSTEVRFQFEAALQAFFFTFLYASMMIATFDDDQEELLEFFNCMCYYFFLFTLIYYLYKYSIHYFSFLEAAKGETKSTSPFGQFLFDALNIIAFVLRFLVLMIRLNIYDGVDDVLDSYYIFMVDFDEEEYFSDAFFSLFSTMSFDTDLHDDRSFLFEDEMDFSADLFTLYFLVWGKFTYFWLFILEEIARVSLALYVTYLLIFEINSLNRSYSEDTYIVTKRTS
jgi:hypothetical protein